MMLLLEAVAHREGFYDTTNPNNRPHRNKNPCNLRFNSESIAFGANAHDGGYAIFPSVDIGWKAAQRWLSVPAKFTDKDPEDGRPKGPYGYLVAGYLGATIEQAFYRFAPPGDNNATAEYIQYLEDKTGFDKHNILTLALLAIPS